MTRPRYQVKWPSEEISGAVFMPVGNTFGNITREAAWRGRRQWGRGIPPSDSRAPTSGLTGAPVIAVSNHAVPAGAANASGARVTSGVGKNTTVGAEAARPSAGTGCADATDEAVRSRNDAAAATTTAGATAATTPDTKGSIQIQRHVGRGATSASASRGASGGSGPSASASASAGSVLRYCGTARAAAAPGAARPAARGTGPAVATVAAEP